MILVAPTAYKGTIGAERAAAALAAGARRARPGVELCARPLSDGGPGLIDALRALHGGTVEMLRVTGPVGAAVGARLLRAGELAVIESADACGLHQVPPAQRDPMRTTSFGVGELLRAAAPAERIVLGLGGSGTVDGGAGMAQALGWRLTGESGEPIDRGGAGLAELHAVQPPATPPELPPVTALADVRNPLLGPTGAARVFGPQKGASARQVEALEQNLDRFAVIIERDLRRDVRTLRGGGAAGGLGAGVAAFLDAELVPGSAWVLDAIDFDASLARAELVITGEGAWDEQSAMGKITGAVVRRAVGRGVPVLVVAGSLRADLPPGAHGVDGGGRRLSPDRMEALAAEWVARLLAE